MQKQQLSGKTQLTLVMLIREKFDTLGTSISESEEIDTLILTARELGFNLLAEDMTKERNIVRK